MDYQNQVEVNLPARAFGPLIIARPANTYSCATANAKYRLFTGVGVLIWGVVQFERRDEDFFHVTPQDINPCVQERSLRRVWKGSPWYRQTYAKNRTTWFPSNRDYLSPWEKKIKPPRRRWFFKTPNREEVPWYNKGCNSLSMMGSLWTKSDIQVYIYIYIFFSDGRVDNTLDNSKQSHLLLASLVFRMRREERERMLARWQIAKSLAELTGYSLAESNDISLFFSHISWSLPLAAAEVSEFFGDGMIWSTELV